LLVSEEQAMGIKTFTTDSLSAFIISFLDMGIVLEEN
jgi:hypothetical protein